MGVWSRNMTDPNENFCYKNEMTEIEEEAIIEITNFSSPCHMYPVVKVEVYACSFTHFTPERAPECNVRYQRVRGLHCIVMHLWYVFVL